MTDDWKGEHFIRRQKLSAEETRVVACRAGYAAWNAKRVKKGLPHPAAKKHAGFARSIFRTANLLRQE
jgi:hypothetical protein